MYMNTNVFMQIKKEGASERASKRTNERSSECKTQILELRQAVMGRLVRWEYMW